MGSSLFARVCVTVLFVVSITGCSKVNFNQKSNSKSATPTGNTAAYVPPLAPEGSVYFQDDFENTSISPINSISGKLNGWDIMSTNLIDQLYFNNQGTTQYIQQSIVQDPAGSGRSVLFAQSFGDDPNYSATSRAQMTLTMKDSVNLPVYHVSYRFYLHPDMAQLVQYPGKISAKGTPDWLTIFEICNQSNAAWDGDVAGSSRWSFALHKEAGAGQPLTWEITGELCQPAAVEYNLIWPMAQNTTVPVPIGKWFTLDYSFTRGEGSAGHILITIQIDGGQKQTIFDIANTTIYPSHPELLLKGYQPFKLYTSSTVLDWMRNQNKTFGVYYNDFKWFNQ